MPLGATLFFTPLLTLLIVLFDRFHAVRMARLAGTAASAVSYLGYAVEWSHPSWTHTPPGRPPGRTGGPSGAVGVHRHGCRDLRRNRSRRRSLPAGRVRAPGVRHAGRGWASGDPGSCSASAGGAAFLGENAAIFFIGTVVGRRASAKPRRHLRPEHVGAGSPLLRAPRRPRHRPGSIPAWWCAPWLRSSPGWRNWRSIISWPTPAVASALGWDSSWSGGDQALGRPAWVKESHLALRAGWPWWSCRLFQGFDRRGAVPAGAAQGRWKAGNVTAAERRSSR